VKSEAHAADIRVIEVLGERILRLRWRTLVRQIFSCEALRSTGMLDAVVAIAAGHAEVTAGQVDEVPHG